MPITRRSFIKLAVLAASGYGTLTALRLYASRIAPWQLSVERVDIRSPRIPRELDGLTLGQISDFHMGSFIRPDFIKRAIAQLNALAPDIAVVTGDYIHHRGYAGDVRDALADLRAPLGTHLIYGNHDHWNDLAELHQALISDAEAHNRHVLVNARRTFVVKGVPLHLVGVDDIWERAHDLERALEGIQDNEPAVLLAHEPDYADEAAARYPFIAQLSGHTHGGQVRLPFIGAPGLPPFGRKYVMGAYDIRGMRLYVNRGIGMALPTVRFLCPPEITLLTLRAG